jgi:hypothetical protein
VTERLRSGSLQSLENPDTNQDLESRWVAGGLLGNMRMNTNMNVNILGTADGCVRPI